MQNVKGSKPAVKKFNYFLCINELTTIVNSITM